MKPAATIGIIVGIIIVIVVGLIAYSYTQVQINLESVSYRGLDFASPSGSTILKLAADFITGNWLGLALTLVTGVKLGLVFGLSNHGFFPVYIPDVSYDILVNGIKVGQGQSHISSTLYPGQTQSFPDNTQDIQFSGIEPAITSVVDASGVANFQVSGTAYFNFLGINMPVPFQQSRQVNIVDEIKNQINSYISQNQQYSQQSSQGNQGSVNSYQQNQQPSYQPPQQTQESVSILTGKTSYNYLDVITMSGIVFPIIPNQTIMLQLLSPTGQVEATTQLNPSVVGTYYSDAFRMGDSNLPAGTYYIVATYGNGRSQTTFSFNNQVNTNNQYSNNPTSGATQSLEQQLQSAQNKINAAIANNQQLVAPTQLLPLNGWVFNNYPRTTTLVWLPVIGASSYTVEIEYWDQSNSQWHVYQTIPNIQGTTYTFNFIGATSGAWRIWSVSNSGQIGPSSNWSQFRYTQ